MGTLELVFDQPTNLIVDFLSFCYYYYYYYYYYFGNSIAQASLKLMAILPLLLMVHNFWLLVHVLDASLVGKYLQMLTYVLGIFVATVLFCFQVFHGENIP